MKHKRLGLSTFLFATAFVPGVYAQPKGRIELLTDQADAVVVGEAVSGQQTAQSFTLSLSIVRTLKGSPRMGDTLTVSGSTRLAFNGNIRGYYGLWFLKQAGSSWGMIPIVSTAASVQSSGFLPFSKGVFPPGTTGATVSDQLAGELSTAIESYTDPAKLSALAYGLSEISRSQTVYNEYARLCTQGDPELRFIGLTGLLGTKDDISALAEIAGNSMLIARLHTRSRVVAATCGHWNPDSAAVRSLGQLALSLNLDLQRCAGMALNFIHTPETLPYLGELLNSPDATTREHAMQGLSRFVDNLPIPTSNNITTGASLRAQGPSPFRTAETDKYSLSRRSLSQEDQGPYLQFWKSWWTTMKDRVTAPQ